MSAFDDKLFGPVAALIRTHDETAAVELTNATVLSGFGTHEFVNIKTIAVGK